MRFLLQKAYSSSNKLPQEATRSLFCELGDGVSEAYSELVTSSTRALNSILQLQEALLDTNPSIAQTTAGYKPNHSIDKWQRKTHVTSGAAAIRGKLHAFNKSISEQVAAYLRDPSKMIKGIQQNRSAVGVFGSTSWCWHWFQVSVDCDYYANTTRLASATVIILICMKRKELVDSDNTKQEHSYKTKHEHSTTFHQPEGWSVRQEIAMLKK